MIGPQTMTDELGDWDGEQAYALEGPGGHKTMVFECGRFLLFTVRFDTNTYREDHLRDFFQDIGKEWE